MRETFRVEVAGVSRELPLFDVAPDARIAVFNLLGDTEIIDAAARGLAERLTELDFDVLVTAETKSVPLVYGLARKAGGRVVAEAAVFTEGDAVERPGVVALGHLPVCAPAGRV